MTPHQKKWLTMKAARAVKRSQAASSKSQRLSKASEKFSFASIKYSEAAREAAQSGSFFQWLRLRFCSKLMLVYAKWLIGKSMQSTKRARIELQKCDAILDSVGVKPKM